MRTQSSISYGIVLFLLVVSVSSIPILNSKSSESRKLSIRIQEQETIKKRFPSSAGFAPLNGALVPSNFYQHPMIGYDCFFGYSFPNCTCTQHNPVDVHTKRDDCYGPKCLTISSDHKNVKQVYGNFTCGVMQQEGEVNSAIVDCSHNANPNSENAFYFSECNPYIPKPHKNYRFLNTSSVLNLFDHEFRFESIDEDRHKTVVKCPLNRKSPTSFLRGYTLQVDLHVHEVSEGFHDTIWVTKIYGCNATAIEQAYPMENNDKFYQLLFVKNE